MNLIEATYKALQQSEADEDTDFHILQVKRFEEYVVATDNDLPNYGARLPYFSIKDRRVTGAAGTPLEMTTMVCIIQSATEAML